MLRSAIYEGVVFHRRQRPSEHSFRRRSYMFLLDLDEVEQLDRQLKVFSSGRLNLFALRASTHLGGTKKRHRAGGVRARDLRTWIADQLVDAGFEWKLGRVELLALPAVLGYVFNPISVWWCYDENDDLRAVLHEVRNTFGDRHCYLSEVEADAPRQSFSKNLHVSPFMDMDKLYDFELSPPEQSVAVRIDESDAAGRFFTAAFTGERHAFSDRTLLSVFVRYPMITAAVVGAIHWHALHLWRKRIPFHRRPEPPMFETTVSSEKVS